ncbi:sulfite exporter TauE/SafE family protein [Aeribacillus alveayuensis]|uniref:Probable membrane transporter protein n=1 Tax=Aeribacillus alveayuensis TaxID=279215 RepID=A0ABT9VM55_9BACI|nr:putative membrane protein YfcA [Bacillus alveayuensis]
MDLIILFLVGLIGGTVGSLLGLGGGIIVVPALLFLSPYLPILKDITPQVAVGTSLVVIIFTGLSSTLAYMKYKKVDYKSGLILFIGSGPGAFVGAWVNKSLNNQSFSVYFGLFMIFCSILLLLNERMKPRRKDVTKGYIRKFTDHQGVEHAYGFHPMVGIVVAFSVGFLSGLFGIGGGSLMVPAMIMLFLFPPHIAVATSMFIIFLSSIVSSITHISLGHVNWLYALCLIPGAWFGGKWGAKINQRLKSKQIVLLLRIILIIVGIRLIFQGLE